MLTYSIRIFIAICAWARRCVRIGAHASTCTTVGFSATSVARSNDHGGKVRLGSTRSPCLYRPCTSPERHSKAWWILPSVCCRRMMRYPVLTRREIMYQHLLGSSEASHAWIANGNSDLHEMNCVCGDRCERRCTGIDSIPVCRDVVSF